jgi:hypothetical protein
MQHLKKAVFAVIIAFSLAACQSGGKQENEKDAAAQFTPAKPDGSVQVSFTHEDDTSQVKILFSLGGKTTERSFDLPLASDVEGEDLYRTVWDKPNSCYVGVLKQNRGTRYYHASQGEDGELKIFQVGTPPEEVWQYAEKTLGLGKVTVKAKAELVDDYKRTLTSGTIVADFIVRLEPAGNDSIQLYTEFGGASKKETIAVPQGYVPKIQLTDKPNHCIFGLLRDDGFDGVYDIEVEGGHLRVTALRRLQ